MLWNKHKYLILLSSIVYDTQDPILIKTFLASSKTLHLFNSMSRIEREKFVEFSTTSMEKYFMDNNEDQSSISFHPKGMNESQIENLKIDMETVLNRHMLTLPPFS